jgi:hypothetical protein
MANVMELWVAMGILAKVIVLGLAAMLVAVPLLGVKLARRGEGGRALGTIVVSGPLFGVLGTVVGLMNACAGIAARGDVPLPVIAAGLGEALLTTALGLVIGLAALWMRAAFEGRPRSGRAVLEEGEAGAARALC